MHRLGLVGIALTCLLGVAACDGTPAASPQPDPDRARECYGAGVDAGARADGGALGCRAGEICLQGRCYTSCRRDGDCGPREECGASGACVRATHDGGVRDGGNGGVCEGVECTAPQVCHPLSGTCVDCSEATIGAADGEPGYCSVLVSPICDIANGRCVAFGPRQCAPCNSNAACMGMDGSFTGTCVLRETLGVREQVCLMPCPTDGSACPNGLQCEAVTDIASASSVMVCVPPIEMPCTNWLAGTGGASCNADTDCAAVGGGRAVYTNACEGELPAPDGGTPTAGHCKLPCSAATDCSDPAQQCLDDGSGNLFCGTPPPSP